MDWRPAYLMILAALAVFPAQRVAAMDDSGEGNPRDEIVAAAAERGCTVRSKTRDIKPLKAPHEGIYEVRCADSHIIWFKKVDGAWTLKPLG